MNWIDEEAASTVLFLAGVAVGLFAMLAGPSLLYVVSSAMVLSGLGSFVYCTELGRYVEAAENVAYTDTYNCDECGDSVTEPEASGEWDCVVCGGRMKRVPRWQNGESSGN